MMMDASLFLIFFHCSRILFREDILPNISPEILLRPRNQARGEFQVIRGDEVR